MDSPYLPQVRGRSEPNSRSWHPCSTFLPLPARRPLDPSHSEGITFDQRSGTRSGHRMKNAWASYGADPTLLYSAAISGQGPCVSPERSSAPGPHPHAGQLCDTQPGCRAPVLCCCLACWPALGVSGSQEGAEIFCLCQEPIRRAEVGVCGHRSWKSWPESQGGDSGPQEFVQRRTVCADPGITHDPAQEESPGPGLG